MVDKMVIDVLHIGCAYYPYRGGSSKRLEALISHQPNVRSHIVTHITDEDVEKHSAASIHRLPKYFNLKGLKYLRKLNKTLRPRAVVLHNPRVMLFWCILVDLFHRVGRIGEIHNFRAESGWKGLLSKILYSRMDTIVVLSNRASEYVINKYGISLEKVVIVRNGYVRKESLQPYNINNDKLIFSFVGTLHDWQGVLVLADAINQLDDSFFEHARVVIAGGGTVEDQMRKKLEKTINRKWVDWKGWVTAHESEKILAESDVILIPRISTVGTELILPLKVFEAMNYGKTILATDVGGLTEVLKHDNNAWIVTPGDSNSLAQAMERLSENPELRNRLGAAARKYVEMVEKWSDSGKIYEELFYSL